MKCSSPSFFMWVVIFSPIRNSLLPPLSVQPTNILLINQSRCSTLHNFLLLPPPFPFYSVDGRYGSRFAWDPCIIPVNYYKSFIMIKLYYLECVYIEYHCDVTITRLDHHLQIATQDFEWFEPCLNFLLTKKFESCPNQLKLYLYKHVSAEISKELLSFVIS